MRRLIALFIIFLTCLQVPALSEKMIPPSCAAPVQSCNKPKLTPIKPFEIFIPQGADKAKLPPLPTRLAKEKPQIKQKISQVKSQKEMPIESEQYKLLESPIKIGTSADNTNYKKISLPEAIDYAMSHNFGIQGTRLEKDKAKNDIKTAGRLLNPRIESYINFGEVAQDNPNYVGMLFPIELFKRGPRKKLATSNLELVKGNVLLAELNLRLDTRQAYVNLVSAKSILKVLDEQRQLMQDLLYIAQKKYEVGTVPQMDVIQAKITLNQLLIQENSARTDVLVARYKFNLVLLSKDFDTKENYLPEEKDFIDLLTPASTDKFPPFNDILNAALSQRLDIKNARQDIDVARKNLIVVMRKRIPDLEVGAGYLFVPSFVDSKDKLESGAIAVANLANIPLLYQYTPEIKNAKLLIEQKELTYKNTLHVATMNLHGAYDSFITAQMNLNYYNDVLLTESEQFLNMARKSYLVGKTNMINLIYVQQSYKNILMGYTTALTNYYNSWINLLREVNDEEFKLNG